MLQHSLTVIVAPVSRAGGITAEEAAAADLAAEGDLGGGSHELVGRAHFRSHLARRRLRSSASFFSPSEAPPPSSRPAMLDEAFFTRRIPSVWPECESVSGEGGTGGCDKRGQLVGRKEREREIGLTEKNGPAKQSG